MNHRANLTQAYQEMGQYTKAESATPHQLITMLFDGAIERIIGAKGAMQREDIAVKGMLISKAITVISGLRAHLNTKEGGELADNLANLYMYAEERLFEANFHNDQAGLDEVVQLIQTLREGWASIEPTAIKAG